MKNKRKTTIIALFMMALLLAIPLVTAESKINTTQDGPVSFYMLCSRGQIAAYIQSAENESLNYSLLVEFKRWIRPTAYNQTWINGSVPANNLTAIIIPVDYRRGTVSVHFISNGSYVWCMGLVIRYRPMFVFQLFSWEN